MYAVIFMFIVTREDPGKGSFSASPCVVKGNLMGPSFG
jgi:hypothetical protein